LLCFQLADIQVLEAGVEEPELVPNAPIRRPAPHRRGKRRPVPAADEAPNPAATDPIAVSNKIFYVTKSHHNYKIVEIFVSKLSILFGSKLWLLPNYGNASKFSYLKNFNN
jgi:hypothetical protein